VNSAAHWIAVLGSVLQSTYRHQLHPTALPEPLAEHARSFLALASQFDPTITGQAQAAFTDSMQSALLYAAVAVGIAALAVTALLHHHTDQLSPDPRSVSHRRPHAEH